VFLDLFGDLGAVIQSDLAFRLDQRYLYPEFFEVLGDFETYIPAADYRGFLWRVLLHVPCYSVGVRQEAQGEDAVEASTVDGGEDGFGARGDHEPIVRVLEFLAGRQVLDEEPLVLRV
jgi:hypothetical protein